MNKTLAQRVKVCPTCKHFIFKDDTVDFCTNCCYSIEPDIDSDIEIVTFTSEKSWFQYIVDIFW